MMLQPAIRSNWQLCDVMPFASWIPDVAGWSAYASIAVISASFPDRREGPAGDIIDTRWSIGTIEQSYRNKARQWMPLQCLANVCAARSSSNTPGNRTGRCIAIARVVDEQPLPQ